MIDKLHAKIEENEFWIKMLGFSCSEDRKIFEEMIKIRITDLKALADFEANREAEAMK